MQRGGVKMDQTTVWDVLWIAIALVIARLAFNLSRRNFTSRKRLPPGPKPWPVVGNLGDMDGLSHQKFAQLSNQYGPLVHLKLGPKSLFVAHSIDLAKEILKTKDAIFASRPINLASKEMGYDHNGTSSSPAGPRWRTLRKMYAGELLTPKRIHNFQALRREEALTALRVIVKESQGKHPVRIDVRVEDHIANIITSIIMNKRFFGPQADDAIDSIEFQSIIQGILDLLGVFNLGDIFPLFKYWDVQGNTKKMRQAHSKLDKILQSFLDDRRKKIEQGGSTKNSELPADFLDTLLTRSGENDEYVLTEQNVKGILQDTILGGVDSSSAVVDWTLSEMLNHPEKLKKAQEELDSVVGRERFVEESDIPQLPYLRAIVKESLRLHAVTPMLVPHLNTQDCEAGGFHIPANSLVMVNVWAIGRDPKLWKNPLEFYPERFLDSSIDVLGRHYELLPFGSGRRQCPGIGLGLLVVQYFVAVLLQGCDWSLPPGRLELGIDMTEGTGFVSHRATPFEAIVTARLPNHVLYPPAP